LKVGKWHCVKEHGVTLEFGKIWNSFPFTSLPYVIFGLDFLWLTFAIAESYFVQFQG